MASTADARYLKPKVDPVDTQHLLSTTVKKWRLLADMSAGCVPSTVAGSIAKDAFIQMQVCGQQLGAASATSCPVAGYRCGARTPRRRAARAPCGLAPLRLPVL